jgi:kumamolisin
VANSSSRTRVSLPGSERKLVPGARVVGPNDPEEQIEVTIRLRSRASSADLDKAVAALGATPPSQRTYLTPEQYTARYGADPKEMERVAKFARDHHLAIVRSNLDQRAMVVSGSAATLSTAFQVKLVRYTSPRGDYRGRLGPLHIPDDLQDIIEGVFGLDNRLQARPRSLLPATRARLRAAAGAPAANEEQARSFYPQEIGAYYNYPAHLTGQGQCIGILEFGGGFSQADLDTYFKGLNLPSPQVEAISVDGVSNQPGADPDIDGEVMLDIEVASALAPGAKIAVYFAPFTEQGWVDAVSAAVHDTQRRPSVLSISWGFTEGQDIWTSQAIQAVNQAFQAAALLGVTVCVASGDDGSQDQQDDGHAHVDFPAGSPYVLACGGTTLQLSGDAITGEVVWNEGSRAQGGGATGGGISEMNPVPGWQEGIVPPSVNPTHVRGRGVPDVAGNADGRTGYTILVDGQVTPGVGGTSAVSPLWAGLIARVNQQIGKPVGFINPLLYKSNVGSALRDITVGTNDPTQGVIGAYKAQPGWDPCTGWGTPDGARLLTALTTTTGAKVGSGTGSRSAAANASGGSNALWVVLAIILVVIVLGVAAYFVLPALGIGIGFGM